MSAKAKDLLIEELKKLLLEADKLLKAEKFSEEQIYSLMVDFHRIKGGAGLLKLNEIEAIAGALESLCISDFDPKKIEALLGQLKTALIALG
jgi:chemotaxis protein histidine kinase CheA